MKFAENQTTTYWNAINAVEKFVHSADIKQVAMIECCVTVALMRSLIVMLNMIPYQVGVENVLSNMNAKTWSEEND